MSYFEARPSWTAQSSLPGGDFAVDGFYAQVTDVLDRWPFLSEPHAKRLVRAYGTRAERILGKAQSLPDLGPFFCGDLTGAEVNYLVENEWARSAEDVLWRRSKLGLIATPEERAALERFMAESGRRAAALTVSEALSRSIQLPRQVSKYRHTIVSLSSRLLFV